MKSLLIVEDDPSQLKALEHKFTTEGFLVKTATNGETGLASALTHRPDGILLDLNMPKMDGIGFLKRIRSDEWGKDAKIIVFTNREDSDAVAECMQYNVFQVFIKANESLEGIVEEVQETIR